MLLDFSQFVVVSLFPYISHISPPVPPLLLVSPRDPADPGRQHAERLVLPGYASSVPNRLRRSELQDHNQPQEGKHSGTELGF